MKNDFFQSNEKLSDEIAKINEINKVNKNNQIKQEVINANFLTTITNMSNRLINENPSLTGLKMFNNEFSEYFISFAKVYLNENNYNDNLISRYMLNKHTKNLTDDEILNNMNNYFLKNMIGNYYDSTKEEYNSKHNEVILKEIIAFTEIKIANKYNEESYYNLKDSTNPSANKEYENFEKWKVQAKNVIARSEEKTVPLVNGFRMPDIRLPRFNSFKGIDLGSMSIMGGALLFLLMVGVKGSVIEMENFDRLVENFVKEYNFENAQDMIAFLDEKGYSFLTEKEAVSVYQFMAQQKMEDLATDLGYTNLQELNQALIDNSVTVEITKDYALKNCLIERDLAQNDLALENGFKDYDSMLNYLSLEEIGNIDEIDTIELADNDYQTTFAELLARKIDNLNGLYDVKLQNIDSMTFPQKSTIVENEVLRNALLEINSQDAILDSVYQTLLAENQSQIFYSPSGDAQIIGNDLVENFSKSDLDKLGINFENDVTLNNEQMTTNDLNDNIINDMQDSISSVADNDLGIMDNSILAGTIIGAGLTVSLKNIGLIKNMLKAQRVNKQNKMKNKISKQVKIDEEREK